MSSLQAEGEKFSQSVRVSRVVKGVTLANSGTRERRNGGLVSDLTGLYRTGRCFRDDWGTSGRDADESWGASARSGCDARSQSGLTPFGVEVWC